MDILQILLGQLPEAIYFTLFMIFAKNIKEKRILFTILMIVDYFLLKYSFKFSAYFHTLYVVTTFLTLKVLYKEKSQLTDIFILLISYIILIVISAITFILFGNNYIFACVINRLLLILFFVIFKHKLYNIQKLYKRNWNRDDNKPKKVKSATFRCINLVIFNIAFYIINLGMLYAVYYNFK